MKAFITPKFSYCTLVWMFHSRTINNNINTLHEKALRLVYPNKPNLHFDDLLKEYKSVKIHKKKLQVFAFSTEIMQANCTVYFGAESVSSLAPKLWELISSEIKSAKSQNIFKDKCPRRLCKMYVGNIG